MHAAVTSVQQIWQTVKQQNKVVNLAEQRKNSAEEMQINFKLCSKQIAEVNLEVTVL